jgi:carbamoyl-phosphate synthase large subunit
MTSVLFTPAGSELAVTGIKALAAREDVRTVSTDITRLAPGLHLADSGYLVPAFDDDEYMPAILDIVEREDIDVVVPALDQILQPFALARNRIRARDARLMLSPLETLEVTRDKWKTYRRLTGAVDRPESWTDQPDLPEDGDLFIKPRTGSGSENTHHITSQSELAFFHEHIEDPIVQEYLPGAEYTVDCITDRDGDLLACVPRHRRELAGGVSTQVTVVEDERLLAMARQIAGELDFVGPFFFQAKRDADGVPRLTEIGARLAGTMCAGFVSPSLQYVGIRQLCGEPVPEPTVEFGTHMSRHWSETYLDSEFERLHEWTATRQ